MKLKTIFEFEPQSTRNFKFPCFVGTMKVCPLINDSLKKEPYQIVLESLIEDDHDQIFEVKDKDISVGDVVKYSAIESLQQYKDFDHSWRCTEIALESKFKITEDDIKQDQLSVLPSLLEINMEG